MYCCDKKSLAIMQSVMSQSSSSTPSRSTQDDRENQLEPFSDSLIEQDLNSSAINSSFNIKSNYNYSPNKSHKKCNHCEKIYRSTTATTNLRKHLLTKHPEESLVSSNGERDRRIPS
ncbi:unnamed protein product [Gordionus sp. m RMFG-2023]